MLNRTKVELSFPQNWALTHLWSMSGTQRLGASHRSRPERLTSTIATMNNKSYSRVIHINLRYKSTRSAIIPPVKIKIQFVTYTKALLIAIADIYRRDTPRPEKVEVHLLWNRHKNPSTRRNNKPKVIILIAPIKLSCDLNIRNRRGWSAAGVPTGTPLI